MSIQGLDWQTVQFSFTGGLQQKLHSHALEAPSLTRALNVEFDEIGGARLRHPYTAVGTNIYPTGTLSNVRKLAVVGDELLAFTSTELYAWSETLTKWVLKGNHMAVASTETARFGNPTDQGFADRAQLGGLIVYVWAEVQVTGTLLCYLAAIDATTKATVIAPTSMGVSHVRPRVVALATKILVTWAGGNVAGLVIDPAAPTFDPTTATALYATSEVYYDVVKDPAADAAVFVVKTLAGADYIIGRVTSGMVVTTSSKNRATSGAIALACSSNGVTAVMRWVSATTQIYADLIVTSTLVDGTVNTAVGTGTETTCNQLTCAWRSATTGGFYRCYGFWSNGETESYTTFGSSSNWIDTAATVGTAATFLLRQGVASHPFDYGGQVYVWTAFAGSSYTVTPVALIEAQLQNTYYLHRDDGELVAKAVWSQAGGLGYYTGHLPGVALVSGTTGFAWCGVEKQIIELGGNDHSAYSIRSPRDVLFTFDSDAARRVVQLGRTAYVSGSIIWQYDGEGLVETGFEQFPWYFAATATGAGGAKTAGAVTYKVTLRWQNACGETERSTTGSGVQVTCVLNDSVDFILASLHITRKTGSRRRAALEVWATAINPPQGAPFYLTTSRNPSATGDNGYLENDPTGFAGVQSFTDAFADATLTTKEQNPENGGILPRFAPPGASIILASDARLFLAGVPGEPTRVWYSLLRKDGEIAAFNSLLSFELPASTGPITALALWQETLVIFTASAVYAATGDGYANVVGVGSNYGPVRLVSSDVGALSHDSVVSTPGGLVFFSRKGWYRINGGWALEYIGADVEDYNTDTWVGAQVVEAQHQVRLLSSSRMLMFDYLVGKWSEWTQASGRGLAIWRTVPMLVDTAVRKELQNGFATVDYDMDVEMLIKFGGLQGFSLVKRLTVLGEFKADHQQRLRLARDYQVTYIDDRTLTFSGLTVGNPTQLQHGPSQKRVMALKVRITIQNTSGTTPTYDAVTLTGIALELGFQPGLPKRIPATQKQ